MHIREFLSSLEEIIPLDLQEDWDNSGLQVGQLDQKLKGTLVCLDVTLDILDQALEEGCNLIISHHPMIFSGVKSIGGPDALSEKIIKAIKNDLVIYASHTSCDLADGGINDYFFKKMQMDKISYISELSPGLGYGAYGEIEAVATKNLVKKIASTMDIDGLILYGDPEKIISKLGFIGGSGASFIGDSLNLGLDLYITGDIKHHDALDAMEAGLSILDLGHHNSERHFVDLIGDWAEENGGGKVVKNHGDEKNFRNIF